MNVSDTDDTEFLSTPSARRATRRALTGSGASADFLSTPSARRRRRGLQSHSRGRYFYPRPPRGGRPRLGHTRQTLPDFYPRPPRGERPTLSTLEAESEDILSTPSARRATDFPCGMSSDTADFYPRPPRGGRPPSPSRPLHSPVFLSTPSARATGASPRRRARRKISIHALREEGDLHPAKGVESHVDFYPRPPRGGRRLGRGLRRLRADFYPRPPRGGRPRQSICRS